MLSDALKSADLRWMRCGCADACAQFDGVREARDAFAMLSRCFRIQRLTLEQGSRSLCRRLDQEEAI